MQGRDTFISSPYLPVTPDDQAKMLKVIGNSDVDDLYSDIPEGLRQPAVRLPPPMAESELVQFMADRAAQNGAGYRASFLGAGAYRRFVPAAATALAQRSEFATAYTPYQPEISQGTLQAAFEYQSVVCELTGMDVSNTGLYDIASATAEACLLACRATRRTSVAILEPLHPHVVDVIRTYCFGLGIRVDMIDTVTDVMEEHAAVVAQQPTFLGTIQDLTRVSEAAHAVGALCVVMADAFSLGLLKAPGKLGADIVTAEGRDLAGPMNFGGPSLGIFATRQAFLREMPGRIVGRTRERTARCDATGATLAPKTGYVLTLQAREQFIRRERATSNFSTGQTLVALAFTIAVQMLGPVGLRKAAALCYQNAHDAAARLNAVDGLQVVEPGPWFQEFLVTSRISALEILRRLADKGVIGGIDVSMRPEAYAQNAFLVCVTEMTTAREVRLLIDTVKSVLANE